MEILKNAINATAFKFVIPLIDSGSRPDYKASPTLAAGDVKVARYVSSAWSVANITSLPTPITGLTTHLEVSLSTTEMTADDDTRPILVSFIDAAGDEWDDQTVEIRLGEIKADVESWDGTAVSNGATSALPKVDAQAISDSTAAADNVEANIGNLDAVVSTRGTADPGDAMDLITDAVDSDSVATTGANEIRDAILSDSTPFAGADIDAAISSRASSSALSTHDGKLDTAQADLDLLTGSDGATLATTQPNYAPAKAGDAMDLVADAVDAASLAATAVNEIRDAILSDSTPFAGANVDAVISTRATPAQVKAQADQALVDIDLDHLSNVGSAPTPAVGSNLDKIMNKDGGQTFSQAVDSLEAIRDRGDTAWITGGAGSGLASLSSGTAQAGAAGSITLAAGEPATDDYYKGEKVIITSGPGAGQARIITGYIGSSKIATVAPDWKTNPTLASDYELQAAESNLGAVLTDGVDTNAATLKLAQLDVQNSAGSALVAKSTGGNGHGIEAQGNETGHGVYGVGGATGDGVRGDSPTTGNGISGRGGTTAGIGITGQGRAGAFDASGIEGIGGSAGGDGIKGRAQANNGYGINGEGVGSGAGIHGEGGATGDGVEAVGGSGGGNGIRARAAAGGGSGIRAEGIGAGHGISGKGGATGNGVRGDGGDTTGDGIAGVATTAGVGIVGFGAGNAAGIRGVGSGNSSAGIHGVSSASGVAGIWGEGAGTGDGIRGSASGANKSGIYATGGTSGGAGIRGDGGIGDGSGIEGIGGSANGAGIKGIGAGTGKDLAAAEIDAIMTDANLRDLMFNRDVTGRFANQRPSQYTAGLAGNQETINVMQDGNQNTETEVMA